MKKIKIIKLIICILISTILIVGLVIGNKIAFHYDAEINSLLTQPIVDKESMSIASAAGQELSAEIVRQGMVLLKNENQTLPLDPETDTKVNVFGWHSIDWLYGTGGGLVSSGGVLPEDDDFSKNVDLYDALNEYGIQYNEDLFNMYNKYHKPFNLGSNLKKSSILDAMKLVEPKIDDKDFYTEELLDNSKEFSETAIVVISRLVGEGTNCPTYQLKEGPKAVDDYERHFLELSKEEEALLTYVGQNFNKVVLLINATNQFECGFLDTISGIDSCFYVGYTGTRGASAIPSVLYGEVSPSGKLADTFAYDLYTNPGNVFTGGKYTGSTNTYSDYIDLVEGIYVGYKWYETANTEGIWSKENGYENGYNSVVQFPFGYGLSYTTFEWNVDDIKISGTSFNPISSEVLVTDQSKIEFTISVKNTGEDYSGREVIEIYSNPPYTKGGIEKSSSNLVAFGKTNLIAPGSTETIKIEVDMYDLASYDCYDKDNNGFKGYELESGKYEIKLMTDSHNTKTVKFKDNQVDNGTFNFKVENTINIEKDPVTGSVVKNLFTGSDAVDIAPIDGNSKDGSFTADIPWLSRANYVKPADFSSLKGDGFRDCTPELVSFSQKDNTRWKEWDNATIDSFGNSVDNSSVIWGQDSGKKLADSNGVLTELGKKLGENYDDEEWEEVLNQVKFEEALNIFSGYYGSSAIKSVGKPWMSDYDGPVQIKSYTGSPRGTGYPIMVTIAQTWNQKLAYEFGKSFGDEMKSLGVWGVWGFAIDCHRNSFFGRNNESPSEDSTLASIIISNAVKGLNNRGRYCFLKHFPIFNGMYNNTFMSEQAYREVYLKSFRKSIVEAGALGVMTSYQSVGGENTNSTEATLTGVLRNEWKFKGAVTTDASGGRDYFIETLIRFGGNFGMNVYLGKNGMEYSLSSTSNRLQHQMKEAIHQVLYMWLRSQYNERNYQANPEIDETTFVSSVSISSWEWWRPLLYSIDFSFGCILFVYCARTLQDVFIKYEHKEDSEE